MKKSVVALIVVMFALAACLPAQTATPGPGVETIVAATLQALTAAAPPPTITVAPPTQPNGIPVSYGKVSFVIPTGMANNALAGTLPAVTGAADGPGWDVAPEHIKFQLDGYVMYGTFHDAYILVFPAPEYAAVNEQAASNIARLQAILNGSAALAPNNLPHVTTFNAAQAFAAQIKLVTFQGGTGVRFLTEYAQYYVTANNKDLFYMFQGLTSDGNYYILAILPAAHPLLPHNEDPASPVPAGGIPFPGYDDQAGLEAYYPSVENLLNTAMPESFTPSLTNLDALVQSIVVAP